MRRRTIEPVDSGQSAEHGPRSTPIAHVVIIIQENRTVDDIFRRFPGADTVDAGTRTHKGQRVALRPVSMTAPYDISHSHTGFETEYANGGMNGFDRAHSNCTHHSGNQSVRPGASEPTRICRGARYDRTGKWLRSTRSPTGCSRRIRARVFPPTSISSAERRRSTRVGVSRIGRAAHSSRTVYRRLRFSQGIVRQRHRRAGPGKPNRLSVLRQKLDHGPRQRSIGELALLPSAQRGGAWHAPDAVKPIRESALIRERVAPSAQILHRRSERPAREHRLGDPHRARLRPRRHNRRQRPILGCGGRKCDRRKQLLELDRDLRALGRLGRLVRSRAAKVYNSFELGFRVPLIVISPYAKQHYVSHVPHELGSILKFTEKTFGLPSLDTTDARADDLRDCFDFHAKAHRFRHVPSTHSAQYFLRQPPSNESPDDD